MFSPFRFLAGAVLAAACCVSVAQASEGNADDDNFLLLREAARQDDAAKVQAIASRLPNYDIPSYVEYYRLKVRLKDAPDDEVLAYLKRWDGSAIADRLRNDWLLELGRRRDWAQFDRQLPLYVINDDTQVKCFGLLSRALKGQKVADEARALLQNPQVYGEPCAALIAQLNQNNQFHTDDIYAQLRLAGEANATGQARRAAALLGASELRAARAVDLPALAMARGIGRTRAEHEIYLVAIGRMARTSLKLASIALKKNEPQLTPQERAIGWAAIALPASMQLAPEAGEYWSRTAGAPLSQEGMQWKVRIALRSGDWKTVKSTIVAMPTQLRAEPAWTYWLARASAAVDNADVSAIYARIAEQNSFYGQLAMEELGQQVSIPPAAAPPDPAVLAAMAANPGFKRALKFFSMRLRFEGTREWNWELRGMDERQLLAAAEFARQNGLLDRMINTSERTRSEFDYGQRFPSPHAEILETSAQQLGLDKAWIYGVIRQESRFITDARSRVGASGLMQVMPATGKYVAGKMGLTDYVHGKLNELQTNLVLGSNYLNMIFNKVDRSQPMATAAYNAGPGRMNGWREKLPGQMEAAIFIESIPFPETRTYVKNVMANATNYAALFENRPQSIKARLGTVGPKTSTELP